MRLTVLLLAALALAPQPSAAQTVAQSAAQRFDDWELVPPTPNEALQACRLRQFIEADGGGVAAEASLIATDAGALLALRLASPVSFPAGIAYRHSNSDSEPPVTLTWQYCTGSECLANTVLEPAAFELLLRRSAVELGWQRLPGPVPMLRQMSLIGLTRAWRALPGCTDALQSGQ